MQATPCLRVQVTSSSICTIGYSPATQVLDVVFNRGAVYRYAGVPAPIVAGFLLAPSKGRYFNGNIRNHYAFRRV